MVRILSFFLFIIIFGCVRSPQMTSVEYVRSSDVQLADIGAITRDAEAGVPEAQYRLGTLYYRGIGVPKSHKEAIRLWRPAAEAGHVDAQYSLGMAYFMGKGITNDFVEGCKWLGKAASQGHPRAAAEYHVKCK